MFNPFFANSGPFNILEILKILKIELKIEKNQIVKDITQEIINIIDSKIK